MQHTRVRRSWLTCGSALLAAALLLTACGTKPPPVNPAPGPASAPAPKQLGTVTIGMSTSASWIPVQVAVKQGFFTKNGVDVKLQVLSSAPDTVKALAAGDLNFAALAVERGIQTTQQGKAIVSVLSLQDNPPTTVLVPADSTLTPGDFKALKGKTAGIVIGGWSELAMRVMIKKAGLQWEEIKTLSTPNPSTMLSSLKSKQVDVLSAIEPSQTLAMQQNLAKVFFDLEDPATLKQHWPQPFVATTLQAAKPYADSHPEVVAAVIKSVQQGLTYVREHTDEVIAEWVAANPDTAKEVWEQTIRRLLNTWSKDGSIAPEALKNVQDILVEHKILTKASAYDEVVYKAK